MVKNIGQKTYLTSKSARSRTDASVESSIASEGSSKAKVISCTALRCKIFAFESRGFEVSRVPNAASATAENVRYKGEFGWLVLKSGIKNSR